MGARKTELDKFKLHFERVEDRRYINVEAIKKLVKRKKKS